MIAGVANAANFGSTTQINTVTLKENQSSQFTLLFWTIDNETQEVNIRIISVPENFSVYLEHDEINISRSEGNEMVFAQDYIAATSVKVFVDQHALPGRYNIILSAEKTPASGFVSQERIFNLTTVIAGKADTININIPQDITETQKPQNNYNFLITILVIIFISFVIYKYS